MQWDVLFHTIFEYFHLLRAHRKHAIESEAISLWTRAKLRRADVTCLEIIIEGHYDVTTLPLLNGIRRPESMHVPQLENGGQSRVIRSGTDRQTTLMFVDMTGGRYSR